MSRLNHQRTRQFSWVYAEDQEEKQTNRAFLSCRLPVSGGNPLWSFRQGKTTRMLQTLASFENKDAVKLGWLQSEKMGGEKEADGGYGSFCLCSGGPLKAFWKMFHHAPWKHYQLLIATFFWVENPPPSLSWFTLLCFWALSNPKKLIFLLTPQPIRLLMLLVFRDL